MRAIATKSGSFHSWIALLRRPAHGTLVTFGSMEDTGVFLHDFRALPPPLPPLPFQPPRALSAFEAHPCPRRHRRSVMLTGKVCSLQVAYTIGWTAISSELSYYTATFGPHMLLLLNAAYFLPSVPVLLLQTVWDHQFDRWFGVAASTATRFVVGAQLCDSLSQLVAQLLGQRTIFYRPLPDCVTAHLN